MEKTRVSKQIHLEGYTIGLDLGGTKILTALVDGAGRIHHQVTHAVIPPGRPELDPRDPYQPTSGDVRAHINWVLAQMADSIAQCADSLSSKEQKKILGVGLASAGPMDLRKGRLVDSSNWKGWKTVPIIDGLQKACAKRKLTGALKEKAFFQNDAVAAALGEGWVGAAKKKETYAMITLGTGVGVGVVLEGRPAQSRGRGCEWGHVMCDSRGLSDRLDDADQGTPDRLVSGTGLVRQARRYGFKDFTTAEIIAQAARENDPRAKRLFRESAESLASLFWSLSLGFNPEIFTLSGGLLKIEDLFVPEAIRLYQDAIRVKYPSFECPVRISRIGSKIGVIGAARLPRLAISHA